MTQSRTMLATAVDVPLWQQPETQDLARSLAWPVGTLLLAALVLMGLVRPGLKALGQPQAAASGAFSGQLDALVSEEPDRPQLAGPEGRSLVPVAATESELRLEDARKLTRDNPAAVANIVKSWINGEAAA